MSDQPDDEGPTTPEERAEVVRSGKLVMELLTAWTMQDAEVFGQRIEAAAREQPEFIEATLYGMVAALDLMVVRVTEVIGVDKMEFIRSLGIGVALYEAQADDEP